MKTKIVLLFVALFSIQSLIAQNTYPDDDVVLPALKYVGAKMDGNEIYSLAEVSPQFPGGKSSLNAWISKNIKYPAEAKGKSGKVIVNILIEKDGSISEKRIAKTPDSLFNKETLRLVTIMPKWIPGKVKGKNVRCEYTFPITFSPK